MSVTYLFEPRHASHPLPVPGAEVLTPEVPDRIGDFAMDTSRGSDVIPYDENLQEIPLNQEVDAIGLTGVKMFMKGTLAGKAASTVELQLPNDEPIVNIDGEPTNVGNVLLVPRDRLMGVRLAVDRVLGSPTFTFAEKIDPTAALMHTIHKKALGRRGVVYDSVVSYRDEPSRGVKAITIASGFEQAVHLDVDLDKIPEQGQQPCKPRLHLVR